MRTYERRSITKTAESNEANVSSASDSQTLTASIVVPLAVPLYGSHLVIQLCLWESQLGFGVGSHVISFCCAYIVRSFGGVTAVPLQIFLGHGTLDDVVIKMVPNKEHRFQHKPLISSYCRNVDDKQQPFVVFIKSKAVQHCRAKTTTKKPTSSRTAFRFSEIVTTCSSLSTDTMF